MPKRRAGRLCMSRPAHEDYDKFEARVGPRISPNPYREGRDPASGIEKAARIAWEMLVQTARKTVIARMKPEPKGAAAESAGRPVERVTFHNEENGSAFSEPRR